MPRQTARCLDRKTIFDALCFVQERVDAKAERREPKPYWREDWPTLRVLRAWGYVEYTPAGEWVMTRRGGEVFERKNRGAYFEKWGAV